MAEVEDAKPVDVQAAAGAKPKPKAEEPEIEFKAANEIEIKLPFYKTTMKKSTLLLLGLNSALVASIVLINFLMLSDVPSLFSTINIIALFIFALPIILLRYTEYKDVREIEEMFPVFLRDFVETIRSGMPLPAAIKAVAKNDYKALNSYVRRMSAQLDWGISVERVMLSFGKRSRSKLVMRIISSVIESHRFGGNLSDTFEALSNTAIEIDRLREERKLYMNSQMITGYVVFFVFLAVMVGLEKFLVPSLGDFSAGNMFGGAGAAATQPSNIAEEYKVIFRDLILIQGLFAGLAVGKMAEGAIMAGMKHSMFMMFVGFLVFAVAG
jgi:flagellar protein FlaJ